MIVATGAEHSGTGLLSRILGTGFEGVLHRAMPHVWPNGEEYWWSPEDYAEARFVVIIRRADVRNASTVGRGQTHEQAEARYAKAIERLAMLPAAIWVSYEALVANPEQQVANLSRALGTSLRLPEPIIDGNARWL